MFPQCYIITETLLILVIRDIITQGYYFGNIAHFPLSDGFAVRCVCCGRSGIWEAVGADYPFFG